MKNIAIMGEVGYNIPYYNDTVGGDGMDNQMGAFRGCLLGMAAGDAMGYTIDNKSWAEIQENYGPNGLLGYDLQAAEYAQVTSYTQIAAFLCNGLLISISRRRPDHILCSKLALKEWTRSQHFYRDPENSLCWLAKIPTFRRRQCRDARMLDNLRIESYGTMDAPKNTNNAPGAITAGVAVGMFYQPRRLSVEEIGPLAGDMIALTHGAPEAFLSGIVLAYTIAGILQEPEQPLADQFLQAIAVMDGQFRDRFPQARILARRLKNAVRMGQSGSVSPQEGMEAISCLDAEQCLAGAMFACLTAPEDFDAAIITAVNHSGLSAAVGAMTGAILGAKLGEDALPAFYLESLECKAVLRTLADDMACGTPALGLFDDAWDHKYVQGFPPEGGILP